MTFPLSPRGGNGDQAGQQFPPDLPSERMPKNFALPFVHYLTIPKNTTTDNPTEYTMQLPIGMIQRLWVEFPAGCGGLVGVKIIRRVYQIFPLPEGVWFRSNDLTADFAFTHSLHNEPFEVVLRGYNLDDTYDHTIWFAFEMAGLTEDLPPQLQGLVNYLKGST